MGNVAEIFKHMVMQAGDIQTCLIRPRGLLIHHLRQLLRQDKEIGTYELT